MEICFNNYSYGGSSMSRLITNAIRSTSASADAITFDNSGKPTFPNGGAGGGKIFK